MGAIMIHASAEAIEFLTSLASLRHLLRYANVRSTNEPPAWQNLDALCLVAA
jgi:hypothetical protein